MNLANVTGAQDPRKVIDLPLQTRQESITRIRGTAPGRRTTLFSDVTARSMIGESAGLSLR